MHQLFFHDYFLSQSFKQRQQEFTIKTFQTFANNFENNYECKYSLLGKTKESQMEQEYWKIVKHEEEHSRPPKGANLSSHETMLLNKHKTTVEYASDLPVGKYGSGFPLFESRKSCDQHFQYATSFFNLNNLYRSSRSILNFSDLRNEKISGVTTPWMYMGMLFSSFCWHVEDLWLNSFNYSHKGATKTWYVIPESDKEKFDSYVINKLGKIQLLNSINFMLDPLELIKAGIKVYKSYQRPKEYICTFFKAYHCGFSQGFNVGEAVNFATPTSLCTVKEAIKFYSAKGGLQKPAVICYDWLIACNTEQKDADQGIVEEYKQIVALEYTALEKILRCISVASIVEIEPHIKYDRFSCSNCKNYIYLTVFFCTSCQKRYCYRHAANCCEEKMEIHVRKYFKGRKKTLELIRKSISS